LEKLIIEATVLTEPEAEVERVMQVCNACRYCEGFCAVFPAMTLGVFVALIGVGIVTRAGQLKERKMGIKAEEFNLKKGLLLAVM
ncbi:hypothetical protein ONO39_27010, partial [Salmonella enterica subsp. enterica serovar Anatum]|nr:hypothetical protein [Salmonella enterica subsp. enterica serovar Anatum]